MDKVGTALLFVSDDVPQENRMSADVFKNVFLVYNKSVKPGAAAGGKGMARVLLSGLDGLVVAGLDGFKSVVGVHHAAAVANSLPDVGTYEHATPAERTALRQALDAVGDFSDGGLFVMAVNGCSGLAPAQLAFYLSYFTRPGLSLWQLAPDGAGVVQVPLNVPPPPVVLPKTLFRSTAAGSLAITLAVAPRDPLYPYTSSTDTTSLLVHVSGRGMLSFSKTVVVKEMCNPDNLVLYVSLQGASNAADKSPPLADYQIFNTQRNDLNVATLGLTVEQVCELAVAEFDGTLHKPLKRLVHRQIKGRPILAGMPASLLFNLRLARNDAEYASLTRAEAPELRRLTDRDLGVDPTTRSVRAEAADGIYNIPVLVNDTGKGRYAEGVLPSPTQVALVRVCALIAMVAVSKHNNVTQDNRTPPAVGILFSDDDNLLGLTKDNVVYINIENYVAGIADTRSHGVSDAMCSLLHELAAVTLHEVSHVLVDISQNHSRRFWDTLVNLLANRDVKRCIQVLCRTLCFAANSVEEALGRLNAALDGAAPEEEPEVDGHLSDEEWVPPRYLLRKKRALK
jgi:hypothetical protein